MRKILYLILSVLAFTMAQPTLAQDERQRKPETVVQDVLAQMPAQTAADFNREMGYLAQGAPQTIKLLVAMLKPAEKAQNALVEYAVSGVTNYANANTQYKKAVLEGFEASVAGTPDKTAREFVETQIRLLKAVQPNVFTAHEGAAPYAEQYDKRKATYGDCTKMLLKSLKNADRPFRVQALEYASKEADEELYTKLAKKFKGLSPDAQTDVLYWLGDNHAVSQLPLIVKEVAKGGPTAKAAIEAAGKIGGEEAADALIAALGTEQNDAALNALLTYKGSLGEKLPAALQGATGQKQLSLIQLASKRAVYEATPQIFALASSSDATVANAAVNALPTMVKAGDVAQVARLLDNAQPEQVATCQKALSACLASMEPKAQYDAIGAQMKAAKSAQRFFKPLAATGTNEAITDMKNVYADKASTAEQRAEALTALKATSNYSAAPTLLEAAKAGDESALTAYVGLVNTNERNIDSRCRKLDEAIQVAKTAGAKKVVLSALSNAPTQRAFNVVGKYLDDKDVAYEAAVAEKAIAGKCVDDLDYEVMKTNLNKAIKLYQAHGTADDGYAVDEIKKKLAEAEPSPIYQLTPEEKKEGFEILFDGTNLDKWEGNTKDYTVQNGTIYVSANYGGGGNLYTKKEYRDFIYRFEFCFVRPGVNNGVGIRTPEGVDAAYYGMCESQILDHDDPIYAGLHEYQVHGSVYGVIPAKRIKHKPHGEWSTEEIRVKGDHITVIVNGETIVDGNIREACKGHNVAPDGSDTNPYTVDHRNHPGMFNKTGHIGFLGHGAGIKFRNVRIKELK